MRERACSRLHVNSKICCFSARYHSPVSFLLLWNQFTRFIVPNSAAQERVVSLEGAQPFPQNTFSTVPTVQCWIWVPSPVLNIMRKYQYHFRSVLWSTMMGRQTLWSLSRHNQQFTINNLLHPCHFFESHNCHFDETYFRVSSIGGSQVMWRLCHWTVSLSRQMWKKKDSGIITLFLNKGTLQMSLSSNIYIALTALVLSI